MQEEQKQQLLCSFCLNHFNQEPSHNICPAQHIVCQPCIHSMFDNRDKNIDQTKCYICEQIARYKALSPSFEQSNPQKEAQILVSELQEETKNTESHCLAEQPQSGSQASEKDGNKRLSTQQSYRDSKQEVTDLTTFNYQQAAQGVQEVEIKQEKEISSLEKEDQKIQQTSVVRMNIKLYEQLITANKKSQESAFKDKSKSNKPKEEDDHLNLPKTEEDSQIYKLIQITSGKTTYNSRRSMYSFESQRQYEDNTEKNRYRTTKIYSFEATRILNILKCKALAIRRYDLSSEILEDFVDYYSQLDLKKIIDIFDRTFQQ